MIRAVRFIGRLPRRAAMAAIRAYQRSFSPDHGPLVRHMYPHGCCRFRPTCSQYTHAAVERFGVIRGSILGAWRILRCNPWSKGGWDPPPEA